MKKLLLLLLLIPLLISCAQNNEFLIEKKEVNSLPEGYEHVFDTNEGVLQGSYYLDTKGIREKDGMTFYSYIVDYDEPNEDGMLSDKTYAMTNCKFNKSKVFTSNFFSQLKYKDITVEFFNQPLAKGQGFSDAYEFKWKKPKKDSVGELILKIVCLPIHKQEEFLELAE
jgi:hypothetical protein